MMNDEQGRGPPARRLPILLGQLERDLVDLAGELELALVLVGRIDRRDRVAADFERLQPVAEERSRQLALAGRLAVDEQLERAAAGLRAGSGVNSVFSVTLPSGISTVPGISTSAMSNAW